MKPSTRIIIYVVLGLSAVWLASGFYANYSQAMQDPPDRALPLDSKPEVVEAHDKDSSRHMGPMMSYGAGLLVVMVTLSMMGAHDISGLVAGRAEHFVLGDHGEVIHDPDYEEAERIWANGNHLEAIQLMRDLLKRNPRHQYIALRIAEVYEKDLNNPVAAALEYEQILEHKLPPERWGWEAIRLANLYSGKLGKTDAAEALLRRIIRDYGQTAAARKARERLGEPEPTPQEPGKDTSSEPERIEGGTGSTLPPGFRPKKG